MTDNDFRYVFHHIPKCGGSSVNLALENWFKPVKDYRKVNTLDYREKIGSNNLQKDECLVGHFELDGFYLHQRYPEILHSDKFRVFSFIRDPLKTRLSLYRYEKKFRDRDVGSVHNAIAASGRRNWLSQRFPATIDNYKEVIDEYFFIGILEDAQASLDTLASLVRKPVVKVPWVNTTAPEHESLTPDEISQFREDNELDYLIYDYCVEKFNTMRITSL
ncbi:MAG: hypothetical protein V7708_08140 [Oceanicoccus sp.]